MIFGRSPLVWAVAAVVWCALSSAAAAAPPAAPGAAGPPAPVPTAPAPDLPPPPDDDGGAADDGAVEDPRPTPEELQAQRESDFREHVFRAKAALAKAKYDEAAREYSAALRVIPKDPEALLGRALARVQRYAEGRCPKLAIRDLLQLSSEDPKGLWLEQRSVAIDWMARCGSSFDRQRLALAREVAAESPGSIGRPDDIRVKVAEILLEGAAEPSAEDRALRDDAQAELEGYRAECSAARPPRNPIAAALRLLAEIHHKNDALHEAAKVYRELLKLHPQAPESAEAKKNLEQLEFELELRKMDATQGWKPNAAAEQAYKRGLAAFKAGRLGQAQSGFTEAIEAWKWFPRAYHYRGVTFARTGRFSEAVNDLETAIRMDRSDHRALMNLGIIYKKEFAGAQDAEAIKHLAAALSLRPDLHQLHLLLGELYARSDHIKAQEHYREFVRLAPVEDPEYKRAQKALEELEREIRSEEPPVILPPPEESLRSLDPELQRMINEAYLRGTEHEDWEGAEKVLRAARDRFPKEPVVLNELARVVYHQDRPGHALMYWEQSLAMEADQVEVHERLGLLLREDLPDKAIPHLRRAADLGSMTARYVLAELLWDQATHPLDARDQLDRYLDSANEYELYWDRAQLLKREIEKRFLQFYLGAGLILTIIIVVPSWRIYRHYRGASLQQLLERDPKSFPEVARILSLIRHEILKHNTAFLADVGRALELDAPDADHRAEVLSGRMFGHSAEADGRGDLRRGDVPAGIYGRFLGYLDELEKVARAHRVTLNLHRKDPIFRPMLRAFEELHRWAPALRHTDRLRAGRKLELSKVLRGSGHVLGRRAFEQLSGLIRELCVVGVDARLVQTVYDRVVGEKQFDGVGVAPLILSGAGAPVRVFRTDLEDILANVIRNSLRSSLLYAKPPVGLGVDLVTELDEITGLGSVAIRIKDRSPEQLSNEMLRGRYVERGMGITVDLLSRYDGSIGVEKEPGWSKAVVVRFFVLEDDSTSLDAEAAE